MIGQTSIHWAVDENSKDIVRVLAELKVDVNNKDYEGMTPAHTAVYCRYPDMINVLAELNADLNKADNHHCTPAMVAAGLGFTHTLYALAECQADLNIINNGKSALTLAVHGRDINCVRALCKLKVNLDDYYECGLTCVCYASQENFPKILQVLAEHKADLEKADPYGRVCMCMCMCVCVCIGRVYVHCACDCVLYSHKLFSISDLFWF